ncbi:hypothetical protein [Virgibacillus dokdonensis]|uniref:Uncharacterized protein n=1 Tax=Virgibacillus dokdonensis TaxID=302167 RepID=A0A2K9IZZ8_9BACI|nr:hypothetical protein [Virgibacillus dokdonensis]AUJ25024.1 hypothetical protein A21D_01943 [Virgibacillus dokdonensis]
MNIAISIVGAIFILSFLLFSVWIFIAERKDVSSEKKNVFIISFVSFCLALIVTLVFGAGIFILLGSIKMTNTFFNLDLTIKQVGFIFIGYLLFLFTIDNVIELVVKAIVGKNLANPLLLLLIRIFTLHIIGLFIGIHQTSSFLIATVVALFIFLIEIYVILCEQDKNEAI